ncbi:MAG TPA: kelch repeat-containing protein [Polyangia bacterium]|jgi:hypothetical protein
MRPVASSRGSLTFAVLLLAAALPGGPGCRKGGDDVAVARQRLGDRFPAQMARIMDGAPGLRFVADADGFTLEREPGPPPVLRDALGRPLPQARLVQGPPELRVRLPRLGHKAIELTTPEGFSVRVREIGGHGEGGFSGRAVGFGATTGNVYWTATAGAGVEEWLLVQATEGRPVAEWHVEGGTLRQDGEVVSLLDGTGRSRLTVSAPEAYDAAGTQVAAQVTATGDRIQLAVAARGEVLVDPLWALTGSLTPARYGHTLTRLDDGKVLALGGISGPSAYLSAASQYDPATGVWGGTTPPMPTPRSWHTTTLLGDGRVLVVGGQNGGTNLKTANLWRPPSDTSWTGTGNLAVSRVNHTATLLANGKVLVVGGITANGSCELYNPQGGGWSLTGTEPGRRDRHTATLLPQSGKVLVTGGWSAAVNEYAATAALYDATYGTWATTGSMATARAGHTATLLANGKVMIAGGENRNGLVTTAELYDLGTGTWSTVALPGTPRQGHTAASLTGDRVLLAGGYGPGMVWGTCYAHTCWDSCCGCWVDCDPYPCLEPGQVAVDSAEVFDSYTQTWAAAGQMSAARIYHAAALLNDGRVLVAGGTDGTTVLASAQLYSGTCGNGVVDPGEQCDGTACCTATCSFAAPGAGCAGGLGTCLAGGQCCQGCVSAGACLAGNTLDHCGLGGGVCASCTDANPCSTDSCTAGTCTHTTNPGCAIAGVCYPDGTVNPVNECERCDIAQSEVGWTAKAERTPCAGTGCAYGAGCAAGVCACCTTCAAEGKNCGVMPDGCGGTLNCGSCVAPPRCGGGGVANVCGCVPRTCALSDCGTVPDGCGGVLLCACGLPPSCGG